MAKQNEQSDFKDLAGALEQALAGVKASKQAYDSAQNAASDASNTYQASIKAAQKARADYDAHVNEAMSGFAQVHQ